MRQETDKMHGAVERIGRAMGFATKREVSISPGAKYEGYAPRLDVAWFRALTVAQRSALEQVGARPPVIAGSLIVAGWEVEGSDVSTRGTQANLANIRVSGAAYGFVALRGGTENNLHERARKAARTQRHYFGAQNAIVLDARWLEKLAARSWSPEPASPADVGQKRGVAAHATDGGEGDWADARRRLRNLGEAAGFDVTESYRSRLARDRNLTTSKIDMVWSLPIPRGLYQLAAHVTDLAKDRFDEPLLPGRFDHAAVVAFELENDSAKHAHGALLNLASHAMSGVFVAGNRVAAEAAEAAMMTYREVFPLSRVTVNKDYVK
jgi:hypothetical protein